LGIKLGKDYLKNSKILAKMINESRKDIRAYWFFTLKTTPDRELMQLLDNNKHEIALHIVKEPYRELNVLERATGRRVRYYTVHGTENLLARLMWGRWKMSVPIIPRDFPLQNLHKYPSIEMDRVCYPCTNEQAIKVIKSYIESDYIILVHPIWLFQRGRMNRRGASFETLRGILA
jgi:hypothetical protein